MVLENSETFDLHIFWHQMWSNWFTYTELLNFAWAYILSARWVELLGRSADHECHIGYNVQGSDSSPPSMKVGLGEAWADVGSDKA